MTTVRLSPTTVVNYIFLLAIGVYLAGVVPLAGKGLLVVFTLSLAAEIALAAWPVLERVAIGREVCFVSGLALAWAMGTPGYPLAGFALAASLLVLISDHGLRLVPVLAAIELMRCGTSGTDATPATLPGATAAMFVVPLAVAALAADAWLVAQNGARRAIRQRQPSWLWLVPVIVLSVVIGLSLGLPAAQRQAQDLPVRPLHVASPKAASVRQSGLSTMLKIGDQIRIDRDQRIAARMEWIGAPPRLPRMVYLRAICLPQVICEGPYLLWRVADEGFTPLTAPVPPRVSSAWLMRKPGGSDAVLHPDGGQGADLEHLLQDAAGNWYQAGLGQRETTYRVSLDRLGDPETGVATVGEVAASRSYPRELKDLPFARIEQPAWAVQTPEDAATEIIAAIQDRCHYELEQLPEPAAQPGGSLATFLLSNDPTERRGHCQYFATAAVILLRRAGHPARTVVGFASEEFDNTGVTFRGIHAHAWLEVVNSRGNWQRFDATPGAGYLMRTANLNPALNEAPPVLTVPKDQPVAPAPGNMVYLPVVDLGLSKPVVGWLSSALVLALTLGAYWWWKYKKPSAKEMRHRRLAEVEASLFACAREWGVPVRAASTLSEVAAALSQRSGIDLEAPLREHLAARFGTGGQPRPWPLADLRRALRKIEASPRRP